MRGAAAVFHRSAAPNASEAAREGIDPIELIRGAKVPLSRPAVLASRTAKAAAGSQAAAKAWAACIKKVFDRES